MGSGESAEGTAGLVTAKSDKSEAKQAAKQECKSMKRAEKAAFHSVFGPEKAMRTCVKDEQPEAAEEQRNAAQECRSELDGDAAEAARNEKAAGKGESKGKGNAFGKCVSSKVKAEKRSDVSEFKNAAKECKAERADEGFAGSHENQSFQDFYGSSESQGKNAFGKCVSSKSKEAESGDDGEEEVEEAEAA
ncbi:MAG: hypothetical protein ACR2K6_01370 [Solirubrobacterales bacterium]